MGYVSSRSFTDFYALTYIWLHSHWASESKSQQAHIYPLHIGCKMKYFVVTSRVHLAGDPGCIALHLPSNQRQAGEESSSKCQRRLQGPSAVRREPEGFCCCCLTPKLMITFILLQVGCHCGGQWDCSAMDFPSRRTWSPFPFRRLLHLLDESCALKTLSSAAAVCNHITSSPWQVALWDFCFQSFAVGSVNAGLRGPFCMPQGTSFLFRYELRVCQKADFIRAAVTHTHSGRTMYRL